VGNNINNKENNIYISGHILILQGIIFIFQGIFLTLLIHYMSTSTPSTPLFLTSLPSIPLPSSSPKHGINLNIPSLFT